MMRYCRRPLSIQHVHNQLQRRCYQTTPDPEAARLRNLAVKKSGAPKSIHEIVDGVDPIGDKKVAIRKIGTSRRVFLLDPYLSEKEMEGLAYRLKILKRNPSLSAVLIATDGSDDSDTLPRLFRIPDDLIIHHPRMLEAMEQLGRRDFPSPHLGQKLRDVARGYDPLLISDANKRSVLQSLADLAMAIRGEDFKSKIPFIFVPHGALSDGGSAFLLSSYVMVTEQSTFSIQNPSRGLALDPTGLSYLLPRLGLEFKQPSAQYRAGCAMMLALMGYKASYSDMVSTGLATHALYGPEGVALLEQNLAETLSYENQALIKEPKRYEGPKALIQNPEIYEPTYDHNAQFRNIQVAELVAAGSSFSAEDKDIFPDYVWPASYDWVDPSLDVVEGSHPADFGYVSADLVGYASAFSQIFDKSTSLVEIYERLKEFSSSADPNIKDDDRELAAKFVKHLETASPLALRCTFRLLWEGSGRHETLEECIKREMTLQANLMGCPDFKAWQLAQKKSGRRDGDPVEGVQWRHKRLHDVHEDEISELFEYVYNQPRLH